jgi:hypothetical protein
MKNKRYHVTKTKNGWKGELEHAKRASVVEKTKVETIKRTVEIAKAFGNSQVIIHKTSGNKIQEERTFPRSNDPKKTKG